MNTIIIPVDFSDLTQRVVDAGVKLAKAFGSRIILLHITEPEPEFVGFEPGPLPVRTAVAHDIKAAHRQLSELRDSVSANVSDVLALHVQGALVDKVLEEANKHEADLIVLGTHGHGAFYELLIGSVTSGVLKHTKCPVLVVPMNNE